MSEERKIPEGWKPWRSAFKSREDEGAWDAVVERLAKSAWPLPSYLIDELRRLAAKAEPEMLDIPDRELPVLSPCNLPSLPPIELPKLPLPMNLVMVPSGADYWPGMKVETIYSQRVPMPADAPKPEPALLSEKAQALYDELVSNAAKQHAVVLPAGVDVEYVAPKMSVEEKRAFDAALAILCADAGLDRHSPEILNRLEKAPLDLLRGAKDADTLALHLLADLAGVSSGLSVLTQAALVRVATFLHACKSPPVVFLGVDPAKESSGVAIAKLDEVARQVVGENTRPVRNVAGDIVGWTIEENPGKGRMVEMKKKPETEEEWRRAYASWLATAWKSWRPKFSNPEDEKAWDAAVARLMKSLWPEGNMGDEAALNRLREAYPDSILAKAGERLAEAEEIDRNHHGMMQRLDEIEKLAEEARWWREFLKRLVAHSIHPKPGEALLGKWFRIVDEANWKALTDTAEMDRRAWSRLADEAGALKSENKELLAENARLRRRAEDLERKAKVRK